MRLICGDRREVGEKVSQRMTAVEVVEKRLHRHPRANKARRSAHDLGIDGDDARFHVPTLFQRAIVARADSEGAEAKRLPRPTAGPIFDLTIRRQAT